MLASILRLQGGDKPDTNTFDECGDEIKLIPLLMVADSQLSKAYQWSRGRGRNCSNSE